MIGVTDAIERDLAAFAQRQPKRRPLLAIAYVDDDKIVPAPVIPRNACEPGAIRQRAIETAPCGPNASARRRVAGRN